MPHPPFQPFSTTTVMCLAVLLGACTGWHTEPVAPAQLVTERHPAAVRLEMTTGRRLIIEKPEVTADSMTGTGPGGYSRQGVALADIRAIAVERVEPVPTTVLLVTLAALSLALFVMFNPEAFTPGY